MEDLFVVEKPVVNLPLMLMGRLIRGHDGQFFTAL